MSTSEFEGQPHASQSDAAGLSSFDMRLPDDFTADDMAFARELDALFSVAQDEVPPLFVQTLLASDDPRFQAVEHAFEKKMHARVFRRLALPRRVIRPARFPFAPSRPLAVFVSACLFFMLVTMAITGPSFAAGLNYLLAGPHSGVMLVDRYPALATAHASGKAPQADSRQINLVEAQDRLHFPMFWPMNVPARYTQSDIYLYPGDPSWNDGPMLFLNFSYALPGLAPRDIYICEFKPQGKVLQVVQTDAAHQIRIDRDGSSAIYVDGQWTQSGTSVPSWVYSDRSELIYEDHSSGVVFWIVGNKRDQINDDALRSIANSLYPLNVTRNMHMGGRFNRVTQSVSGAPWLFAEDVVYLDNPDNPNGPALRLVNADPEPPLASRVHENRTMMLDS